MSANVWAALEGQWHRGPQQELAAQVAARREYAAHVVLGRALGYWGLRWAEGRRVARAWRARFGIPEDSTSTAQERRQVPA